MIQFANKESLFSSPGLAFACHYIIFFVVKRNFAKKGNRGHRRTTQHEGEM